MVLEEMTCHYWAASMTMHGVPLPHPMSKAGARLALSRLARSCGSDRLRCAAGGALVSFAERGIGAGEVARLGTFESANVPCDVEPA